MSRAVLAGLLLLAPGARAAMPAMSHGAHAAPHEGHELRRGEWTLTAHGTLDLVWDRQGGARGGEKGFLAGMLTGAARRPLGPGAFGLRARLSPDPAMGPSGYPLLLQTGETADGRRGLVDRQHPHDLFTELSASYDARVGERGSVSAYAGLPGEPALGPGVYMHRPSGAENPEAPISHHWLDSTHVSEGAGTFGASLGDWKLEGSVFTGREPDQYRWDIEKPRFDSHSGRLSWNPGDDWAFQASYGRIVGPEALEPGKDTRRFTASASVNARLGGGLQHATFAYGRNDDAPGRVLDAYLLEAAALWAGKHAVFGRAERVEKDELISGGGKLAVGKASLGYRYDFAAWKRTRWGVGGSASVYALPAALRPSYGRAPASFMLFLRAKLA